MDKTGMTDVESLRQWLSENIVVGLERWETHHDTLPNRRVFVKFVSDSGAYWASRWTDELAQCIRVDLSAERMVRYDDGRQR